MGQTFAMMALVVKDYDEAIDFYTKKLGFQLLEDTALSEVKRWVRVQPSGGGAEILLAKAANAHQESRIGDQTGGRVFLFMYTDDFDAYYAQLLANGVTIIRQPSIESFGKVCVFADLYGNLWDLIGK